MNNFVDQIERRIKSKHQEALKALDVLRQYLADGAALVEPSYQNSEAPTLHSPRNSSISDRVLAIVGHEWASVERIILETGLKVKQVRGVINAPRLKGKIERRKVGGQAEYRLKQAQVQ